MGERYHTEEGYEGREPTLDELLCEYVDGTMDPVVREIFEEVLATDAELAEEVQALCCTREMLCRYGCRQQASPDLEARFQRRLTAAVARETIQEQAPLLSAATVHLSTLATFVSIAALAITLSVCTVALVDERAAATAQAPRPAPTEVQQASSSSTTRVAPDRLPLSPVQLTVTDGPDGMAFLQRTGLLVDPSP